MLLTLYCPRAALAICHSPAIEDTHTPVVCFSSSIYGIPAACDHRQLCVSDKVRRLVVVHYDAAEAPLMMDSGVSVGMSIERRDKQRALTSLTNFGDGVTRLEFHTVRSSLISNHSIHDSRDLFRILVM